MKNRHLRARLPDDEYRALQADADAAGLTVSEHVRNSLLRDRAALDQEQFLTRLDAKLAATSTAAAPENASVDLEPLLVESLLLARESAADRNAQILTRVASQLNAIYPQRKKL